MNNNEEQFVFNNDTNEEQELAQISSLMENEAALRKAREEFAKNASRPSLSECEQCGDDISEARQKAVPGVRLCIECANFKERRW
jgi:phage/conjugal plasmid C-4 type zinc finger TraR family protein